MQDDAVKCRYCGDRQTADCRRRSGVHHNTGNRTSARSATQLSARFWLFELVGIAWFVVLIGRAGFKAGVNALMFALVAPIAWVVGNASRKFVMPGAYFASGVKDLFKQRLFWMVGPQSIPVFMVAGLLTLFAIHKEAAAHK